MRDLAAPLTLQEAASRLTAAVQPQSALGVDEEPSSLASVSILGTASNLERERPVSALAEAEDFLHAILGDSAAPATTVKAAAMARSIAWVTVRRAAERLGVRAERVGGLAASGHWVWRMSTIGPKALNTWSTPRDLFDRLDTEFGFALDAAASPANAKCARYHSRTDDGLRQPWVSPTFCNPPYTGRGVLGAWIAKAARECDERGVLSVLLLPARTGRPWWREHIQGREVRFLPGRLTFEGAPASAPFDSVIVVFRPAGGGEASGEAGARACLTSGP